MHLFRFWLTALSLLYPVYWLSRSLTQGLPALIGVAFFEHQLVYLRVTVLGAMAASFPPHLVGQFRPSLRLAERDPLLVTIPISLCVVALAFVLFRRNGLFKGLPVAAVGLAGLLPWMARILRSEQLAWQPVAGSFFFLGLLLLGLRQLAEAAPARGFWWRFVPLCLLFPLPLLLTTAFRGERFLAGFSDESVLILTAACWVVSFSNSKPPQIESSPSSWKPLGLGLSCCALLLAVLPGRDLLPAAPRRRTPLLPRPAEAPLERPYPKRFFQKGVNFTAEWPDPYSSAGAQEMLRRLPAHGIDSIALVPYGFIPRNSTRIRFGGGWERDEGIAQLSRQAHQQGMKVLLKPQIWTRQGFPGDLEFSSTQERIEWFQEYRLFIGHYARLATRIQADLFCVGVEFSKLTRYEHQWRRLITFVRTLYPGPLVYAANFGSEFETLQFWDQLDYIGLDNYYPLPDDLSTQAVVEKVAAVSQRFQRPILFTEAGFSAYEAPHRRPWDETSREISLTDQARCYEAILQAFYHQPWFEGVYWWKVGTNGYGGPHDGSHTPWGKPAMQVLSRWYLNDLR